MDLPLCLTVVHPGAGYLLGAQFTALVARIDQDKEGLGTASEDRFLRHPEDLLCLIVHARVDAALVAEQDSDRKAFQKDL